MPNYIICKSRRGWAIYEASNPNLAYDHQEMIEDGFRSAREAGQRADDLLYRHDTGEETPS